VADEQHTQIDGELVPGVAIIYGLKLLQPLNMQE
jgi:hypothetical protein